MNENNKPLVAQVRYAWVDYSKAILIFLMVLGHSSMPETIKTYFYAFHMPAFFVISGFLYKPKPFWYTTLSFFVPVVIFSFFIYLIYILNGDFESTREKYVIMLFPGFWFIETLYIIRLFAGDFFNRLKFRKNSIFYIMSLIIIIFLSLTSALEEVNSTICRILACFPFWTFGYYLKKSNVKFLNKQYSYIIMLICLLITHFYGRCDVAAIRLFIFMLFYNGMFYEFLLFWDVAKCQTKLFCFYNLNRNSRCSWCASYYIGTFP